jgi:F0F1-type ATP synthase assembly protein I
MPDGPLQANNPETRKSDTGAEEKNVWRQIGRYSNLGMILPAAVVVGLLIGAALDHYFKTKWITLVGLLVGCVAGFTELIRGAIRAGKDT